MQPFNYTTQVANPIEGALRMATMANQFKAGQQQLQAGELQLQQQQAAAAQAATQRARAQEVARALSSLGTSPDPKQIVAVMTQFPEIAEKIDPLLKASQGQKRDNDILRAQQTYAAVLSGDVDIAEKIVSDEIAGYRDAGLDLEARMAESRLEMIKRNPKGAAAAMGMYLARAMGPEQFAAAFDKIEGARREGEMQPARVAEQEAKATSAAVAAKFAESNAALDLQKKGWDITKLQNDVQLSRINQQIATAQASLNRQLAPLQVQEAQLKIQNLNSERDKRARELASEATAKYQVFNEAQSLVNDILSPENEDALKGATGFTGLVSAIPGTPERAIAGKVKRLAALLTADNLSLMSGVLTDKDMQVLERIAGNFDMLQEQGQAIGELRRAGSALKDGRAKLVAKYGPPPKPNAPEASQTDW